MMLVNTQQIPDLIESFVAKKYRHTKSFATKTVYTNNIKNFYKFLAEDKKQHIENIIELVKQNKIDPIVLLDDYYTYLRGASYGKQQKSYSNASIRSYLTTAKEFLRFLGIKIYNEDVKQVFKLPPKQENSEPGLEKKMILRILRNSAPNLQVAILMCCSSGVRDGELVQLKVGDIDFQANPVTVNLRAEIVKGKIHPRKTHLTTEAANALKDYLVKNKINFADPNDQHRYIFLKLPEERIQYYQSQIEKIDSRINKKRGDQRKHEMAKTTYLHKISQLENQIQTMSKQEQYDRSVRAAKNTLIGRLIRVVDSVPDLAKRHEHDLRDIHFHSFRYFFKTSVTDSVNSDFAEALLGHISLKLTYYKKNEEQRKKSYKQAEQSLTISDTTIVSETIENMQKTIDNLARELEMVKQWKEFSSTHTAN